MHRVKINVINPNNNFNVYINEKQVELTRADRSLEMYYEKEVNEENCKIKFVQKHICDYNNWFLRGMSEFLLGLISGIGGYSDNEEHRGPFRAYCEGILISNEDVCLNVQLVKSKKNKLATRESYNFNISVLNNKNAIWKESKNEFESPEYLRRRWNIIRVPYLILFIAVVVILILAFT